MFTRVLEYMIREGSLRWIDGKGRTHLIGDDSEPVCTVRVKRRSLDWTLMLNPGLRVPEAYMNGDLEMVEGAFRDFIHLASVNYHWLEAMPMYRFLAWIDPARLGQYNPIGKAQANVAHHYDLSDDLYRLFLDSDRQYSCAYFQSPDDDIETAQKAKKRHIAAKLRLEKGQKALDIGCGWGGLGLYLARVGEVDMTGLTLSVEQHAVASRRAQEAGVADRVRFKLQDYRDEPGTYDRIVSVGMFEHVGARHYDEYFGKVAELLAPNGVMLLHSIGRLDAPCPINAFIRKYIFPGADLPSMSEVLRAIEPTGLYVTDIEVLRLHYAETLRLWRERFLARRAEAARIYDERFVRMWDAYLSVCEVGFRHQHLMVFQMQIAKGMETLPMTRDYMVDWERAQAEADAETESSAEPKARRGGKRSAA
jgi:cyclopropane-fatty-acyl-phospholipid synthase